TAVALAMRFNVDPLASAVSHEQKREHKEKEKEHKEKLKERRRSPEFEEGVRAGQKEAERTKYAFVYVENEERERHREEEMKARDIRNATLMRLARIPMDQAIQIALSQQPSKALESSLGAEHWEDPEKLATTSFLFYHNSILSGDENSPTINHVLVNAVDGTIIRNEKELPRKSREPFEP